MQVTPTGRHALTYDEESWKATSEEPQKPKDTQDEISRSSEARQSKTKRVKNYLKKCKNVLHGRSATENTETAVDSSSSSSWYIEKQIEVCESEEKELDEVFEETGFIEDVTDSMADLIEPIGVFSRTLDPDLESVASSPFLTTEQNRVDSDRIDLKCLKVEEEKLPPVEVENSSDGNGNVGLGQLESQEKIAQKINGNENTEPEISFKDEKVDHKREKMQKENDLEENEKNVNKSEEEKKKMVKEEGIIKEEINKNGHQNEVSNFQF